MQTEWTGAEITNGTMKRDLFIAARASRKDRLWDAWGDPSTDGLLPSTPERVLVELAQIEEQLREYYK